MPDDRPQHSQNGFAFPSLPIIAADEVRKSQAEKYGGLFYLGVVGLVVLIGLIGWFGWGVWSLRDVWANVYILNDPTRPEADRLQAAQALSSDSRVAQPQLWELTLDPRLPEEARFRLASGLKPELIRSDPRTLARAAARSEWPTWLRLAIVRLMAYAAEDVRSYPPEAIETLGHDPDPMIRNWSNSAGAGTKVANSEAKLRLETGVATDDPVLKSLQKAFVEKAEAREKSLDQATALMCSISQEAAKIWGRLP